MVWNTIQDRWKKVAGNTKEHWARLARGKHASTERRQTDDGLRNEREKTDSVLEKWQQGVERRADDVVELARDTADAVLVTARANADAVLEVARDKADEVLDSPMPPSAPRDTVESERLLEDEALLAERSAADEGLRRERVDDALSLARLMPLEREATDRYLLTERARSDAAVSNRDDFLGLVTHDLRDLLAGIAMSTSLLSRRAGDREEGAQTLVETQRIERYVARMLRLVGDLTDVTSIDAGKLSLTLLRGDSSSLLTEAVETFHASAQAKGISLEVGSPGTELEFAL